MIAMPLPLCNENGRAENASHRPSGDQTGWSAFKDESVTWTRPVPSLLIRKMAYDPKRLARLDSKAKR